jgi:Ca2+-binding RTX toxin-like protein
MSKNLIVQAALASLLILGIGIQPAEAVGATKPKCTITGTAGDDILTGTDGSDVICGLGGNDLIQAGNGSDVIWGGSGNDKIIGGAGIDTIFGGTGDDSLVGEGQNDVIDGGKGKDQIFGGEGNDTLLGSGQDDFIRGEAGNDKISGGAGNDMISGGLGKDSITSNEGKDTCAWDRSDVMKGPCKLDKVAPVITAAGEKVQRVQAGTTAYFRWNASDSSGIEESWLSIGGASGWVTKWCGFIVKSELVKGTASNGEFEAKCDIPATAPNLEYSVWLSSRDYMGNISTSDAAITFEVFGGSADTAPPTFEYLAGPISIKAGKSFEISWRSTDETDVGYSGVYFALNGFSFSDGFISYVSAEGGQTKLSGNDKDAIFTQRFTVHPDAPASRYTLWSTRADSLGNKVFDQTSIQIEITR